MTLDDYNHLAFLIGDNMTGEWEAAFMDIHGADLFGEILAAVSDYRDNPLVQRNAMESICRGYVGKFLAYVDKKEKPCGTTA